MHGIENIKQSDLVPDDEEPSERFRTYSILFHFIFLPAKLSFQHYCVNTIHKCTQYNHFCRKSTLLNKKTMITQLLFPDRFNIQLYRSKSFVSQGQKNNLRQLAAEISKSHFAYEPSSSIQHYGMHRYIYNLCTSDMLFWDSSAGLCVRESCVFKCHVPLPCRFCVP
jgi:hypothetical protein